MVSERADICPNCGVSMRAKHSWPKEKTIYLLLTVLALVAFGFGVLQYAISENWKRSDFVAKKIEDFYADSINRSVLIMLDYEGRSIELFPERADAKDKYVKVDIQMVQNALREEAEDFQWSAEEFRVREYFDHYLRSLSRLNYYIETEAIKAHELCADFGYWVNVMVGEKWVIDRKGPHFSNFPLQLKSYLDYWNNDYVKSFITSVSKTCP
jgi:hypothetical protein